jgi:hypothetical protein
MGIGENANGRCHVIYRLNIETGEKAALYEELNEYFDVHGDLIGVTFEQFRNDEYDKDLFESDGYGGMNLKGGGWFGSENVGYVYVAAGHLYMRAGLRESLIQNGSLDCIAILNDGAKSWG